MVEMLGVLAIIWVLSVGGIAGYSKAMMKYKINKFSVAMNELLNTAIQYKGQLYSSRNAMDDQGAQYFSNILDKMNALPEGIRYKNDIYLEDMFGNQIWVFAYPNQAIAYHGVGYTLSWNGSTSLSNEICHQLIKIVKENSSQIWYTLTNSSKHYGDVACSENAQCLRDLTISEIEGTCHSCRVGNECRFYIFLS